MIIIIMLFIFTVASLGLSSCTSKGKDDSKGSKKQSEEGKDGKEDEEKEKLDPKEAEKVMEEYAKALIKLGWVYS